MSAIGKHKAARRIDASPASNFAVADVGEGTLLTAPPASPVVSVSRKSS